MAFDKAKTLRAAEKYLELGKLAPAIKEYCQIVAVDPEDFTTVNMLGDLYVRMGNHNEAIGCFRRIAEHYREQGFGLKAIAMYRKIDRLQPNNVEIATHLADLYAQQDLVVEARTHYLSVIEAHNRAGKTSEVLDVLRKIADLDPQNTAIRTRLAESYLKEGMKAEAATAFSEAGQILVARGALDDALESFGKALEMKPAEYVTLKGLLAAHCARGTADEAAEIIQQASSDNPDDCELLAMLANAYVEADEPHQAERVTALLVGKEPGAYLRFIQVAHLYLRHDKINEAVRVVSGITEQMLAEREQNKLLDLVNELLSCDSDNVQALRLLVRAHWWLRDMESVRAALERLAETAQMAGLEQDERYALTQLNRLAPGQPDYVERLNQLGGAEEYASSEALPDFDDDDHAPLTATEEFVFNSEEVSTTITEPEFEWNTVSEPGVRPADATAEPRIEHGFTFESVVAEELPSNAAVLNDHGSDEARAAAIRQQELESVDFYIAQGYMDIALDTLELLEKQGGQHDDIAVRRQRIKNLQFGAELEIESEPVNSNENVKPSAPIAPSVTQPDMYTAPAVNGTPPQQHSQLIDAGLAEIFEEYRASSENDAAANGDYETHYNLGLAYKEMDLFEEALEEFQVAAKLSAPGDGTPRYLQCCNLLGHCFMQTGAPELAIKWFDKGANAPGISEDERLALTYEIAAAYETAGELTRALEFFTEVYGMNVSYRGVNERLRTLKARLSGKDGRLDRRSVTRSEQLVN